MPSVTTTASRSANSRPARQQRPGPRPALACAQRPRHGDPPSRSPRPARRAPPHGPRAMAVIATACSSRRPPSSSAVQRTRRSGAAPAASTKSANHAHLVVADAAGQAERRPPSRPFYNPPPPLGHGSKPSSGLTAPGSSRSAATLEQLVEPAASNPARGARILGAPARPWRRRPRRRTERFRSRAASSASDRA